MTDEFRAIKSNAGEAAATSKPNLRFEQTKEPHLKKTSNTDAPLAVVALVAMVAIALIWVWFHRSDDFLSPEEGLGYWLGIAGASMMLAVLLYPMRKRIKFMRNWGRIANWFRWHMFFGFVGPAFILIHSNFHVDSVNALAALVAMLAVVFSGIIGRYLYARIHRGLYGARIEARELLSDAVALREIFDRDKFTEIYENDLRGLELNATAPCGSLFQAIKKGVVLSTQRKTIYRKILKEFFVIRLKDNETRQIPKEGSPDLAKLRTHVDGYFKVLARASVLNIYDQLFALWHVLHLPLIVVLFVTAVIHIVAVNLY